MPTYADPNPRLKALFLGDRGPHKPAERARQLIPPLLHRGIETTYTDEPDDLNPETLGRYDALILYANIDAITPEQESALLAYVEGGKGFVPIHCASFCFRNSERCVALIGGQFKTHGTGVFRTRLADDDHPAMRGFQGFESWDETYIHHRHNERGRAVLEYRDDEPYTWVRTQGKGRVFYTAWGHDERTWGNPGFLELIERGVRWAAGQDVPAVMAQRSVLPRLNSVEQRVAYYPPHARWGTTDNSWNRMQVPLSPEESVRHMVTPAGFHVELFAAEPQIGKPLCMAWDERGRLWIAESVDYPHDLSPAGEGRDRIRICEDRDGDGRAETFTVFAEGLSIPTAIAFARGGIVVHQAPDTLFLSDTDGDGRADERRVLFTGWGVSDTHAGPSNLQYALDNTLHGSVGYAGFRGRIAGEDHRFAMGFYRFAPDGSWLEFLGKTNNNTWGLGHSEEGIAFGSTANNNPSVHLPIAARRYASVRGMDVPTLPPIADSPRFVPITERVRQVDVHGGYTAAAGHALYTARRYPRAYWNRTAFVCEPTGHLIGSFRLTPDGAGFHARNPSNLLSSDDEWCAPIMAEVGPDGHVWFIDWYNYIVQHNPTPSGYETGPGGAYVTDLRDKSHGRIYRIVYDDGRGHERFSLANAGPETLVSALSNDNLLWRRHAQRLLVERGEKDIVPDLLSLIGDTGVDDLGLNVGAIHALWTLHGLGALEGTALRGAVAAIKHPSAGVRKNAAEVLPPTSETGAAILHAGLLDDPDAQVRLAALLALARTPPAQEIGAAVYAMIGRDEHREDRVMLDAAAIAGSAHSTGFLAAANKGLGHAHHTPTPRPNLIPNPGFETRDADRPSHWSTRTYSGRAELRIVSSGRDGGHAVEIRSTEGADASWTTQVAVKPQTQYRLSAWVRTQGVDPIDRAAGVLINAHELQPEPTARTPSLTGTQEWRRLETIIDTRDRQTLLINCLFGGWGRATGTAWFDDVALEEIGPSAGSGVSGVVAAVTRHALIDLNPDAPADTAEGDTLVLQLATLPNLMRYDRTTLKVPAGRKVRIVFTNNDVMPHNVLLLERGSMEKVGAAADAMIPDPEALGRSYIPDLPEVLASTPLINPQETGELRFTAPTQPGQYPYLCTFPGHWRIMRGTLIVEPTAPQP